MSSNLVRDYATNLGFEYYSASTKEEFIENAKAFLNPQITDKPILIEAFTTVENEIQGDYMKPNTGGFKGKLRSILGDELYTTFSSIVNGKGIMNVDTGKNKK